MTAFACVLLAILVVVLIQLKPGYTARSAEYRRLAQARTVALGCRLYAFDHDKRFPESLAQLSPDYINYADDCNFLTPDGTRELKVEYFGGGFLTETRGPVLLRISPEKPGGREIIIYSNCSGIIQDTAKK